jgi:acyl-CoA thioesterase I
VAPVRAAAYMAIAAALVAGCGAKASPPAPHKTPASTRLVVVGDSLAAGRFADTQDEAFPQLAAQTVPAGGDVVVVEAGTNDFIDHTARAQFTRDYRALLAKVTAASPGAKLVCLTMWIPAGAPTASSYNATIRRECRSGTVADISPIYTRPGMRGPAGRSTFLGPGDDFHPNSAGHAAIAQLIEARI